MPSVQLSETPRLPTSHLIFLETEGKEEKAAVQVPVIVKNLTADVVTVEVENPWYLVFPGQGDLLGKVTDLCLSPPDGGKSVATRGKVAWTRHGGEDRRQLKLGIRLDRPTKAMRQVLEESVAHTPKDLKDLWDRWDNDLKGEQDALVNHRVYLAGLVLMLGGLILQFPWFKPFQLFGWILWFLGSLGVAGRTLWSLWHRRASR
jgi:hypothetical protein